MKNKIADIFILLLLMACLVSIYFLIDSNKKLEKQITLRDNLITNSNLRDSLYTLRNKENAATINEYTEGCVIMLDNKRITVSELVSLINSLYSEKAQLQKEIYNLQDTIMKLRIDSLQLVISKENEKIKTSKMVMDLINYKDSTNLYKLLYNFIQRQYGTNVFIVNEGKNRRLDHTFSRADSAKALYPFFKDRIRRSGDSIIISK